MVVEIDGAPHMIEHIQVQTPSARGAATLYKIKARNLKTKTRVEKTYKGTDALDESSFERGPSSTSTATPTSFTSWTRPTSTSSRSPPTTFATSRSFMTENMEGVEALVVDDEVIAIELPDTVDLPITDTAPGVRGNSATAGPSRPRFRPATSSRFPSTSTRADRARRYADRGLPRQGNLS